MFVSYYSTKRRLTSEKLFYSKYWTLLLLYLDGISYEEQENLFTGPEVAFTLWRE